jgi:hypothetical protein
VQGAAPSVGARQISLCSNRYLRTPLEQRAGKYSASQWTTPVGNRHEAHNLVHGRFESCRPHSVVSLVVKL